MNEQQKKKYEKVKSTKKKKKQEGKRKGGKDTRKPCGYMSLNRARRMCLLMCDRVRLRKSCCYNVGQILTGPDRFEMVIPPPPPPKNVWVQIRI